MAQNQELSKTTPFITHITNSIYCYINITWYMLLLTIFLSFTDNSFPVVIEQRIYILQL